MSKTRQGQSALEYIILVAAFLSVLIIFLRSGGVMHRAALTQIEGAVDQISTMAQTTNFLNAD